MTWMSPYRIGLHDAPLFPRVRWGRVLMWSAQIVVLVVGIACAMLARAYAELAAASIPIVTVLREPVHRDHTRSSQPGITRLSPTDFYVTAEFVDHLLEEQQDLRPPVRILPISVDGRVTGIELFGIRPGSTLADLGFENHDILETINDYDVASPESSLEAYSRLRETDWVRVVVVRDGKPVALHYYIQ